MHVPTRRTFRPPTPTPANTHNRGCADARMTPISILVSVQMCGFVGLLWVGCVVGWCVFGHEGVCLPSGCHTRIPDRCFWSWFGSITVVCRPRGFVLLRLHLYGQGLLSVPGHGSSTHVPVCVARTLQGVYARVFWGVDAGGLRTLLCVSYCSRVTWFF